MIIGAKEEEEDDDDDEEALVDIRGSSLFELRLCVRFLTKNSVSLPSLPSIVMTQTLGSNECTFVS